MCGIVGIWNVDGRPVDVHRLVAARDVMTARGPDDAGLHVEPGVGLGHRRLSIIDLSPAGRMPMANETDDVWAVFNGEIYNFAVLRTRLEQAGHRFRSHTDSEVVIHAYEEWGTKCFAKFDGMFAIALWDRREQQLVLARDIAGEKPLFYRATAREIAFGSTLDAVRTIVSDRPTIDQDAVRAYLEFGYVPAPGSILVGVHKVEPGTFVVCKADGTTISERYWSIAEAARRPHPTPSTLQAAGDRLLEVLRGAVRTRLVADVPLGAFLSGGVDSSLVVALMAETRAEAVRTFTIGFHEPEYDESAYARQVANHLGVENTVHMLSAKDVLAEIPRLTAAIDEPMADYSALPSLAVARLARAHVTVALSGDGADEAFGGYRYYGATRAFETVTRIVPTFARKHLATLGAWIPNPRLRRAVMRGAVPDAATYFGRSGFYRGATANGAAASVMVPASPGHVAPDVVVADYVRALSPLRPTEAGMVWDAAKTLSDAWLTKVDRTSMAVGLETRAPFLQREVLEHAFALPLDLRVRGNQRKILLRHVLTRFLPPALVDRPKQGFTPPLRAWFANELRDELCDRLTSQRMRSFEAIDARGVKRALDDQLRGKIDHTQLLWALFHLVSWEEAHQPERNARTTDYPGA